ncbi:MAG: GNAT family N-acetyltransferase [Limnochordia bacterium]|jgi:GNAT superfamily N-acetyltransferase|nr:GNAT family N-acetyltransferase [Limnochordia bacterium]
MGFVFQKANLGAAVQIVAWDYPAPYQMYNLHGSAVAMDRLVDGPYYAAFSKGELMGFFCYGTAAQLNGKKDHVLYTAQGFLDVGLGMHPAWCSRGHGVDFLRSGLLFARNRGWQEGFRLTVASNNIRACKVYSRLGFQEIGRVVWDSGFNWDFVVMTLDTPWPDPQVEADD